MAVQCQHYHPPPVQHFPVQLLVQQYFDNSNEYSLYENNEEINKN